MADYWLVSSEDVEDVRLVARRFFKDAQSTIVGLQKRQLAENKEAVRALVTEFKNKVLSRTRGEPEIADEIESAIDTLKSLVEEDGAWESSWEEYLEQGGAELDEALENVAESIAEDESAESAEDEE